MSSKRRDNAARAAKPATLRDELLRFATFSSIRGVPRSLKSRSWGWSIVWTLAVICFLTISGVFVYNLVHQFSDFNTFYEINSQFQSHQAPFPSVTICNLQPFSSSLLDRVFAESPIPGVSADELIKRYDKLLQQSSDSNQLSLTWKSFFLQNWGHRRSGAAGMRFSEFVLNNTCLFKFSNNSKLSTRPCSQAEDVVRLFHSKYFTCFMISPPASIINSTYSLELDLYLDTESSLNNSSRYKDELFTLEDSVGGFVAIHTPNTFPDITHGVHVHPGTKSVIELVSTKLEKKIEGFFKSPCTRKSSMQLMATSDTEASFAYKATVCRDLLTQSRISDTCQCKDPDLPVSPGLRDRPFCAELPQDSADVNITSARISCAMSIELATNANSNADSLTCPLSCEYISYSTTAYQSMWPPKSNELEFYNKHVAGRSEFGSKFNAYAVANSEIKSGNMSVGLRLLQATDLIRNNFLRLYVFRPDLALLISEEKYQISWEALVSQIGGAFSLWAGLTVITVIEVLELMYYVVKRLSISVRDWLIAKRSQHVQQVTAGGGVLGVGHQVPLSEKSTSFPGFGIDVAS